jgi:predicted lysophospholipase L1 biosynthesis ABC-type transport system permease subunit
VGAVRREGDAFVAEVRVARGRAGGADRVRDAAAALDPLAQVQPLAGGGGLGGSLAKIRAALTAGAFAVLLMIGASLLLATAEQVRERRGVLSVLSAFGARRSTIARSVMWQSAIPVAIGIALAIAIGSALGTLLMRIVGLRIAYDWGAVASMAGAGALVIALVTGLTLPLVARQMSPDALRVE